jgi:hypothetical protein
MTKIKTSSLYWMCNVYRTWYDRSPKFRKWDHILGTHSRVCVCHFVNHSSHAWPHTCCASFCQPLHPHPSLVTPHPCNVCLVSPTTPPIPVTPHPCNVCLVSPTTPPIPGHTTPVQCVSRFANHATHPCPTRFANHSTHPGHTTPVQWVSRFANYSTHPWSHHTRAISVSFRQLLRPSMDTTPVQFSTTSL